MRCLSVCLSVCLSRSYSLSKRINICSNFFHCRVATPFQFFPYQTAWQYSDRNPSNGGVECRWGRQKSRFWAYIWLHCLLLTLQQARCYQYHAAGLPSHKLTLIAGSKWRCWERETMTNCLWQETSTLRQRQQNSAFNCTQWQISSLRN